MPETTPLIKAALNLRVGAGFDVYHSPSHLPQENMLSQKRISIRSMSSPALLLSLGN